MSGDQSGQLLTFLDNHTLLIVVVVAIWIIREREKGIERRTDAKIAALERKLDTLTETVRAMHPTTD